MRAYEMDRYLRDKGLKFEREGGRHRIYALGKHTVAIPRGKSFKTSTTRIIEKFLKDIGVHDGPVADSISLPAGAEELVVPESACESITDDNYTKLPPGLYEVFKDFIHFCEANQDKAGEYNIGNILNMNGHQLPDWNSLLYEARRTEDISVLFDLNDALEMMKLKSFQLHTALQELEKSTAPRAEETRMQEQVDDFHAAKVVDHGERLPYQPHTQRPRPSPIIAPVQKTHQPEFSQQSVPASALPLQQTGYSLRQGAFLDIVQILGRLQLDDAKLVLQQANGFVEMG